MKNLIVLIVANIIFINQFFAQAPEQFDSNFHI